MGENRSEIYAGDQAWQKWFDICSVAGCDSETARKLARQIRSALSRKLKSYDLAESDWKGEPTLEHFFDVHFLLGGRKDRPKPLKEYYLARLDPNDRDAMRKLVCGTFFSSSAGRVNDIAREIVRDIKGWTPHKIMRNGHPTIVWETSVDVLDKDENGPKKEQSSIDYETGLPSEPMNDCVAMDESGYWDAETKKMFDGFKYNGADCQKNAAIVLYVTAFGISPSQKLVQKILGIGMVQAYKRFKDVYAVLSDYCKKKGFSAMDTGFLSALLRRSEKVLGSEVINKLNSLKKER